ncbi:hypothetical protein D1P53_003464 [Cryptococcus gattii VGV]|nr:hypothetical protein D1P53_003464 [Cryptococcus gattii VGV]
MFDAAQLCHVLRGQQEIAQARELYTNATMEKIALLKHLKDRDLDRLQRETKLEEYIEHQYTELQTTSRELRTAYHKMQLVIDRYEFLSTSLDQSIQSLSTGRESLWENVQENIQYQTALAGQLFAKEAHQLQHMLSEKLTAQLGGITNQYGAALSAQTETADTFMKSLHYEMKNYLSDLTTQQTAQMATLQDSWEILAYQTSRLVRDMQTLGTGAEALQGVLEQSHDIAISTKVSQELAAARLQASVEQAQRLSTSLNETEGRMDLMLTMFEARQQQLDRSWRWSPSLFASPALISLGQGKLGFASIGCRGLLVTLDICWQVICYMLFASASEQAIWNRPQDKERAVEMEKPTFVNHLGSRNPEIIGVLRVFLFRDLSQSFSHTPERLPSYQSVYGSNISLKSYPGRLPGDDHPIPARARVIADEWVERGRRSCTAPL